MKRVVTRYDKDGKSVFVKIGELEHGGDLLGMRSNELWAIFPNCQVPVEDASVEPTRRYKSIFPFPGETCCRVVEYAADGSNENQEKNSPEDMGTLLQRNQKEAPRITEHMEEVKSGMHTNDSVDYGVVLKGNMVLDLMMEKSLIWKPVMSSFKMGRDTCRPLKGNAPCYLFSSAQKEDKKRGR
jgi:hypothetical protein